MRNDGSGFAMNSCFAGSFGVKAAGGVAALFTFEIQEDARYHKVTFDQSSLPVCRDPFAIRLPV